jgi:hypothetical protein
MSFVSPIDRYLQQGAIGLAAGVAGALMMNVFARAVNRMSSGREADGAAPGADRVGRGMQPPQAEGTADQDAAVRAGTAGYRALTGHEPGPAAQSWLGTAAHYAFSGVAGVSYALITDRVPAMRAGYGTLYGAAVWAIADEGVTPALGLSRSPRELPLAVHLYALAGHVVYGATLESVRRFLTCNEASVRR